MLSSLRPTLPTYGQLPCHKARRPDFVVAGGQDLNLRPLSYERRRGQVLGMFILASKFSYSSAACGLLMTLPAAS